MRDQVLIPDLSATEAYNLHELRAMHGLIVGEAMLAAAEDKGDEKAKKEAQEQMAEAEEWLAEAEKTEDAPVFLIGYVPGPLKSKLRRRMADISQEIRDAKKKNEDSGPTPEQQERLEDAARDWIKYGVKGHANIPSDIGFETEEIRVRGRAVPVASENMVELYEQAGLLFALESVIARYNTLGTKKKSRSRSTSGDKTVTSTAQDVPETPH